MDELYAPLSRSTRCYRALRAAIELYALLSRSTRCYNGQVRELWARISKQHTPFSRETESDINMRLRTLKKTAEIGYVDWQNAMDELYAPLSRSTRCYRALRAAIALNGRDRLRRLAKRHGRTLRAALALYALLSRSTRCYRALRAAIALHAPLSRSTRRYRHRK
jgi:hypothetical protein